MTKSNRNRNHDRTKGRTNHAAASTDAAPTGDDEQSTGADEQSTTAADQPTGEPSPSSRALGFARRHPVLTVIGAAGAGLLGGFQLVAGVLIGASAMAVVRRRTGDAIETEAHAMRDRARRWLARRPEVQQRARAVVQAARGELQPHP